MVSVEYDAQDFADAQSWLQRVAMSVGATEGWTDRLNRLGVAGVEYAQSISPVVTGSYRSAHTHSVRGMTLLIEIDPGARNSRTGTEVTRYATNVEKHHEVYARTMVQVDRLAASVLDSMAQEIV